MMGSVFYVAFGASAEVSGQRRVQGVMVKTSHRTSTASSESRTSTIFTMPRMLSPLPITTPTPKF